MLRNRRDFQTGPISFRRSACAARSGFTVVEALVVSVVTAMLATFMLSGGDAARRAAARAVAMDNMKFHGEFALMNAGELPDGILHAPHANTYEELDRSPSAGQHDNKAYAMGGGDWDWGGKNGIRGGPLLNFAPGGRADRQHRGADGRFMNRFLAPSGTEGFEIFEDPGDCGLDTDVASAVRPQTPGDLFSQSVFAASGNSYMGDFFFVKDHNRALVDGGAYRRFGAYRRKLEAFPETGRALLFWESRFIQALANTEEIGGVSPQNGPTLGIEPRDITGWHGEVGQFLATFADGHTAMIECRAQGSLISPSEFRDGQNQYWRLHWRAPNWRYDNFPAPMVTRSWFSPILSYSGKWLGASVRGG